ncbi:MAG TPA: GIDE domain-containing protein [Kofleriaceae bacterium]|nr:GIDE domain-containing protein [Kofleriaceae bacterium]
MFFVLVVAGVVLIGGGIAVIERMTRAPDVSRLLGAPLVPIAEAADATDVRIEGTVEVLDDSLRAPASNDRCVYYEHEVRRQARRGLEVERVHHAVRHVPFVVRDASGYAIVDAEGATALLSLEHRGETSGRRDLLDGLEPTAPRRRSMHDHEVLIRPGDRLIVIGRGVREPDPDPSRASGNYRDGAATRLRLSHSPQFPLHLIHPSRMPPARG